MPRFVILEHDHPERHFDFMLEDEGVLLTWRLPLLPQPAVGELLTLDALRLADHRLHYLDYEGPVSGNRGTVTRRDSGSFRWLEREETHWQIELCGMTQLAQIECTARNGSDRFSWRSLQR